MKKRGLFLVINILFPLAVGGFLYAFFCPNTLISSLLFGGKTFFTFDLGSPFDRFIRFYFLDMLWAYSFLITACCIMGLNRKGMLSALLISAVFETAVELFQYFGVFGGTFDIFDLLAELLSSLIGVMVLSIFVFRKEKQNEK